VAENVEPLKKLLELRSQLADLRGKIQSNDKLDEILSSALGDEEKLNKLKAELEAEKGDEEGKDG
jgi:type VI secretion system protein ImpB